MTKLNFSSISEAYVLGSDSIKNTSDEISKLKLLLMDSSIKPVKPTETVPRPVAMQTSPVAMQTSSSETFTNTCPIDQHLPDAMQTDGVAMQTGQGIIPDKKNSINQISSIEDLYKIMEHPKFDSIIQNYLIIHQPSWLNKFNQQKNIQNDPNISYFGSQQFNFIGIIFYLAISLIIYLLLKEYISS